MSSVNMLHHISLPVSDFQQSKRLYDAVLSVLGYSCVCSDSDFAGYGVEENKDKFLIKQMSRVHSTGAGFHLAFSAPSRKAVDRFYEIALEHGAKDNGAPGFRKDYGPNYYAAFIKDLDGHRIEVVINEATS